MANLKTKLLESIILDTVKMDNNYNDYQFGFFLKKGNSTALCTSAVKQTIEYYINRGSHMCSHVLSISARPLITLTTRSSLNS